MVFVSIITFFLLSVANSAGMEWTERYKGLSSNNNDKQKQGLINLINDFANDEKPNDHDMARQFVRWNWPGILLYKVLWKFRDDADIHKAIDSRYHMQSPAIFLGISPDLQNTMATDWIDKNLFLDKKKNDNVIHPFSKYFVETTSRKNAINIIYLILKNIEKYDQNEIGKLISSCSSNMLTSDKFSVALLNVIAHYKGNLPKAKKTNIEVIYKSILNNSHAYDDQFKTIVINNFEIFAKSDLALPIIHALLRQALKNCPGVVEELKSVFQEQQAILAKSNCGKEILKEFCQ